MKITKQRLKEIIKEELNEAANPEWDSADKIFRAFNVTVRMTYQLPRETHRYLIEPISESIHPKAFLANRFLNLHSAN